MKLINAKQVALLLETPLHNAACTIYHAKGEAPDFEGQKLVEPNPSINVDLLSEKTGIDFGFFLAEIRENYLKRSATKGWIMNYPLTRLKPKKDGSLPSVIKPPTVLMSLLDQSDIDKIISMWNEKYDHYIVHHKVRFSAV